MNRPSGFILALATLLVVGSCGASPLLLGHKACTYGPSYWCENIPQAKQCSAVSHCKQTVWEQHVYPTDNDEICKICLDMVTQARDQLRSNETLDDLKAVFEGSCALIPVKVVRKECDKLVDNFIPELVEALSSEMDPTAVCSVAGLCNNKAIDQLLLEHHQRLKSNVRDTEHERMYRDFSCDDCGKIGQIMVDNFKRATPDDVLDTMLQGCRYAGSFSDACASLAITNFQKIYDVLEKRLTKQNICHLSGACALGYHQHAVSEEEESDESGLEIRTMGNVGLIKQQADDVPCELCKQLIDHLRDMVVANSTKEEFKEVLDGICAELGSLADECKSIVNEYSDVIFNGISLSLNSAVVCGMIKICPTNNARPNLMMPLLSLEPAKIAISLKKKEELDAFQLPFDTLMGPQNAYGLVEKGQACALCEMVLHFVQQSLAQPATAQHVKETLEKTCNALPQTVRAECDNFVDTYGDAVLSMLIQEIDPTEVCPMMKLCSQRVKEDVEIFEAVRPIHVEIASTEKPTCPLCLFAVEEAQARIQSDKSIANIKHTLETLCNRLPQKLNVECMDFVDSYAKVLVSLLVKDLTPQQICVELKLCTEAQHKAVPNFQRIDDSMENTIPDNTVNGRVVVMGHMKPSVSTPECLACQELVKVLEKKLDDKHSRKQIKKILDHVCDEVKQKLKDQCLAFMAKHEDQIIDLVMKGVSPKELCTALGFCFFHNAARDNAIESMFERAFDPMTTTTEDHDDSAGSDEAFSIDFISIPAGPLSLGRISLTNGEPQKVVESRQPPAVLGNQNCIMCEFVMTKLEASLNSKATQEEIKKAVEGVCSAMPKSVKAPCTKFVDSYAELIVTLLATTPPAKICQEIKMCKAPAQEVLQLAKDDVFECAVCQGAVTVVDRMLEDPKFDRDLEKVVERTCAVAPKLYKPKCAEMVSSYAPSIINMLLANAQPEKVCEEIGLCFPNEVSTFIQINEEVIPSRIRKRRQVALGASKCTWGPSYWCDSKQNADECSAHNYCQDNGGYKNKSA